MKRSRKRPREQQVFPKRHVENEPVEIAILRNNRDRGVARHRVDATGGGEAKPSDQLDEFALTVAINPGKANDFAQSRA